MVIPLIIEHDHITCVTSLILTHNERTSATKLTCHLHIRVPFFSAHTYYFLSQCVATVTFPAWYDDTHTQESLQLAASSAISAAGPQYVLPVPPIYTIKETPLTCHTFIFIHHSHTRLHALLQDHLLPLLRNVLKHLQYMKEKVFVCLNVNVFYVVAPAFRLQIDALLQLFMGNLMMRIYCSLQGHSFPGLCL